MITSDEQRLEARLRRLAAKHDLMLVKNRSRTPEHPTYGGFMICEVWTRGVVAGAHPIEFCFTLDDVKDYLAELN
jgi:hypothetical protein